MGLAVDEEGHDDGDDQAHDDGDDDAHVQRHVVGARGRWGGGQRPNKRILHLIEAFLKKASDRICVPLLQFHLGRAVRHTEQQVLFHVKPSSLCNMIICLDRRRGAIIK